MKKRMVSVSALLVCLIFLHMVVCANGIAGDANNYLRVISDRTVKGFIHPESVAFDPLERVLYVSQFGSVLKPTLKDGKGKISKVSLAGEILEEKYLPSAGEVLNKPKGVWIEGNRLWVTDIDAVWVFDLRTRQGRKVMLPDARFANDPTVVDNMLLVSDSQGGKIYGVEPADFLNEKGEPDIVVFVEGQSFSPNGLYPSHDGSLLTAGHSMKGQNRSICSVNDEGKLKTLSIEPGRLDGIAQLKDGSLLITDWNSGALLRWDTRTGIKTLATGFAGPADFCIVPENEELLVVVPDLVKSELRMIRLSR